MKILIWLKYVLAWTCGVFLFAYLADSLLVLIGSFVMWDNLFYNIYVDNYDKALISIRVSLIFCLVIGLIAGTHDAKQQFKKDG